MNWKRIILWSLPLWVVIAVLWTGLAPLSRSVHDDHVTHVRNHVERVRPLPPEPLMAEEEPVAAEPAPDHPHEHHFADPEAVKHYIDEWLWVLDYIVEYGNAICGLLLAAGQVFILIKLKGGVNK